MLLNIQILRAVAALIVLVLHTQVTLREFFGTPILDRSGEAGVDLFFVISGFLMVYTTRDRDVNVGEFWKSRLIRIFPLYWIALSALLALMAAGLVGRPPFDQTDILRSYLLIPGVNENGSVRPLLIQGWTLTYELYFYLLFGLCLLVRSPMLALTGMMVWFAAISLTGLLGPTLPRVIDHFTSPLAFEFIFGALIGVAYGKRQDAGARPRPRLAALALVVGALCIVGSGRVLGDATAETYRTLVWGVPAALIVFGAVELDRAGKSFNSYIGVLLGNASYAIYLFHWMIIEIVTRSATELPFDRWAQFLVAASVGLIAAVVLGVAIHLYVEQPLQQRVKSLFAGRKPLVAPARPTV